MPDRRPLSSADIDAALASLPGWRADTGVLRATFATTTVVDALALIAAIGALAEELDHHPDVDWRYRRVFVRSTTHSAGDRLTELDIALAAQITAAAVRLGAWAEAVPENQ